MNILLTGCSGFIGRHFNGDDNIKRIVVRRNNECNDWECERFYVDSIDDRTCWDGAFDGVDSVVHLAGLAHSKKHTSADYQRVNVEGTLLLAKQAASSGVRRFVFVSSIGVNGLNSFVKPLRPDSQPLPFNDYTLSKHSAEIGLMQISKNTGLEVVIVRPTLVYGLNAPGNFNLLSKLISLTPILPFRMIDNKRDFIAVDNLIDLLKCCAIHPDAKGQVFLACDGETVSIRQFTNQIAKALDRNLLQLPIPPSLFRLFGNITGNKELIDQLIGNLHVDNSSLMKKLNWVPPYSMEEVMSKIKVVKK